MIAKACADVIIVGGNAPTFKHGKLCRRCGPDAQITDIANPFLKRLSGENVRHAVDGLRLVGLDFELKFHKLNPIFPNQMSEWMTSRNARREIESLTLES